ncbi:aminotransferase class I/II-fold pyridoxal phosphate-dependent enzyme [Massilia sp. BSC265]|uniref:aminotransferase class I/II-fold pyridoxal phosphate-dependent enzyme n=1 Tax=Massilia sp. BSC265 TaxID=1549812 RepID=UPI000B2E6394|nr:aminotransferase class I/II-fold pyridoxal phosphate-dependent enzyme [Massilia sp. BSC265]
MPSVPVLSPASFFKRGGQPLPSLLDAGAVRMVTSGRIAIGLALREMGIQPGDKVLVPAYHSPSMIPPVHWCGASVVFYRVRPDSTIDIDDIAAKLDGSVKAVMATHFFGFPQDLRSLRALCDAHGAGLLEDCAHAFFGHHAGTPVGSTGDYAIGSSMKFYPIYEGGCLVSHRRPLSFPLRSAGPGFEAKAALAALETAFAHGRLQGLRLALSLPLRLKGALWNALKSRRPAGSAAPALAPDSSDSSFNFDPRWVDKRSSLFSRLTVRFASRARIVALRRRHYLLLQQSLDGLPGCRPLFPTLPEGACPWIYPLLVDQADAAAASLQAAGVPMVRFGATLWPGVDAATCANSVALGRQLIGFPCHQELRAAELERLRAALRRALGATAALAA